jgi:hypothetical protein
VNFGVGRTCSTNEAKKNAYEVLVERQKRTTRKLKDFAVGSILKLKKDSLEPGNKHSAL